MTGNVSEWMWVTATTGEQRQRLRTDKWRKHKATDERNRAQTRVAAAKTMKHQAQRRKGALSTVAAAVQRLRHVEAKGDEVQMDQQDGGVSTDKIEKVTEHAD